MVRAFAAAAILIVASANALAADPAPVNEMCPVLPDEPVDPSITVQFEGRTIGLCCLRCRAKFLADPEAYRAALPSVDAVASAAAGSHDHATDHAHDELPMFDRLVRFIGKFHPVVVHFPIALLVAAAVAELLLMATGRPSFAGAARFSTIAGAVGALIAAPLGWVAGANARYPGELTDVLSTHRWLGTGAAGLAILAAILVGRIGERRRAFRIVLFASVAVVGVAGHFGATLIYGTDYFAW